MKHSSAGRSASVSMAVAVAIAAGAAGKGSQAQAQDAADSGLDEVVVTAQFREENLQTTPIAISTFSAESLTERNFTNVDDIGISVPNAYIRQPVSNFGPTTTIGMRGVIQGDLSYSFVPAVGIYIDDVYHGTLTGSSMDLLDLDRVEVLRGPQGTLFGINTMGGALRLISKKPQGDNTGSVDVTYGERQRIDVKAVGDFSVIEDKLFARISGISRRQNGYGKHLDFTCEMVRRGTPQLAGLGDGLGQNPTVGGQPIAVAVGSAADNSFSFPQVIDPRQGNDCSLGSLGGAQTQGVRLQLRHIVSDRLELNLSGDYSTQTSDPPVETLLTSRNDTAYNNSTLFPKWGIRADGRFITGNPYTNFATFGNAVAGTQYDETTHLRSYGVSLVGDYGFTDKTHLKVIGSYRAYETTWINDSDLTPFELIQTNYLQEHHQSQFEAQLTGASFADRLDWTLGAFYYQDGSRAYNTANFVTFNLKFTADDLYTTENKSVFAHAVFRITDRLSFNGGLRYTDESKTNWFRHYGQFVLPAPLPYGDEHVSYKAGLDFQWTDNFFLYASVSDGFTSAGVTPRIFTQEQLQPLSGEEVTNYEIGSKLELFDRRLRINTAVFFMDYSKRLLQVTATQCNLPGSATPGNPYFLAGGTCPAGTPAAGTTGTTWFYYTQAPGEVKGFEAEIVANPLRGLTLNASVGNNLFKGDQTDTTKNDYRDSSALLQPRWNISAGGQYAVSLGNWGSVTPRLDYYYQSYRTNGAVNLPQRDPQDINPGYGLYNARLTYEPSQGDWSVAFSVLNLTDHFYWQQLGSATQRANGLPTVARVGTPGKPREWAIQFRKSF